MTLRHHHLVVLPEPIEKHFLVFNFIRWLKPVGCDDINVKDIKVRRVSLQLGILLLYYTTMILDGK